MFYALEGFLNIKWVTRIALVVDNPEKVVPMLQEYGFSNTQKVTVVKGELTRHRSIKAGLQELHKKFSGETCWLLWIIVRYILIEEFDSLR